MTSRDFCFWLQGWFELNDAGTQDGPPELSAAQTEMVRRHLAMVFKHEIDPSMGHGVHQTDLDTIHAGSIFDKQTIGGEVQTAAGPVKYRC